MAKKNKEEKKDSDADTDNVIDIRNDGIEVTENLKVWEFTVPGPNYPDKSTLDQAILPWLARKAKDKTKITTIVKVDTTITIALLPDSGGGSNISVPGGPKGTLMRPRQFKCALVWYTEEPVKKGAK